MSKPTPPRQLEIIETFGQNHSFSETAKILGISKQRVHQIIAGKISPSAQERPYRKKLIDAGVLEPKIIGKKRKKRKP